MRALITGCAGFIGSHLADRLVLDGAEVCGVDNLSAGTAWNIRHLLDHPRFSFFKGDVREPAVLDKAMRHTDVVCHLAALVHVDASYIQPKDTFRNNIESTLAVLEECRWSKTPLVLASSSEVYGSAQTFPMAEDHPLCAMHPYGASKVACDRMAYAWHATYNMPIFVLRCFNTYGPRQKDYGYGGVVSLFIRRVKNGKPPIIFGSGEQTRDFMYIEDAVSAYICAIEAVTKDVHCFDVVNFGTGVRTQIRQLAWAIIRLMGKEGKMREAYELPRLGELDNLMADIGYAKDKYGWGPGYTLDEGLSEFIAKMV